MSSSGTPACPEGYDLISQAIQNQAAKIDRVLPSIQDPIEQKLLADYFHNYSQSTFDRVSERLMSADVPVHDWEINYMAVCRAIDECYKAQAMLSEGNLAEALESLLNCASSLGVYEGSRMKSHIRGTKAANARHKDSPQRRARMFVRECWEEWLKNPSNYQTQSEFALDMLSKVPVNDRGQPAVSYDTIVKKWIPAWKKEER